MVTDRPFRRATLQPGQTSWQGVGRLESRQFVKGGWNKEEKQEIGLSAKRGPPLGCLEAQGSERYAVAVGKMLLVPISDLGRL